MGTLGEKAADVLPSRESALEIGVVGLALTLVVGLGAVVASEVVGRVGRARGRGAAPPTPGSLPPESHRNVAAVSTR